MIRHGDDYCCRCCCLVSSRRGLTMSALAFSFRFPYVVLCIVARLAAIFREYYCAEPPSVNKTLAHAHIHSEDPPVIYHRRRAETNGVQNHLIIISLPLALFNSRSICTREERRYARARLTHWSCRLTFIYGGRDETHHLDRSRRGSIGTILVYVCTYV